MKLHGLLDFLAKTGRPILSLLGVKKGTVADKVAEGAVIVNDALPPEVDPKKE